MTKVYRLEDDNGNGPFHGDDWATHPSPSIYEIKLDPSKHVFGCSSLEQLKSWHIENEKCRVSVYEVESQYILYGRICQLVFEKNRAVLLERIDNEIKL